MRCAGSRRCPWVLRCGGEHESVGEVHFVGFQEFGVVGPVAYVVGVDDQVEAVVGVFAGHVGDLHADFQEFALVGVDAGGFGVDPEEHVGFSWRAGRVEGDGPVADGEGCRGVVHSLPFLMLMWVGRSSGGGHECHWPSVSSSIQPRRQLYTGTWLGSGS